MTSLDSGPGIDRPRRLAWGDALARDAMTTIAAGVRVATGFDACAIEVVRSDDMIEFVALVTDDPAIDAEHDGSSAPLSVVTALLGRGVGVGPVTFVRSGELPPDDFGRLVDAGIVLDLDISDDPAKWHPEDVLVAQAIDSESRMRGFISLDVPRDGLRPTLERLAELEELLRPALAAVLVNIEREELAQRHRLTRATRAIIGSASPQMDLRELFSIVRTQCVDPFLAQGIWVGTLEDLD